MKNSFIRWLLPSGRVFMLAMMFVLGGFVGFGGVGQAEDQKAPTTGDLIAGEGFEKIHYKNITLTPGGFFEATALYRSANENADVGSTYGNIPLTGTTNSALSEFRGTARQSRISLLAETELSHYKMSGYFETDFLGAAPTANEVESNSWNLRLRQAWSTVEMPGGLSVTLGQAWSLVATNRNGLKPRSEYIPSTIDAQYVVGYNWARQFGLRVTQNFGDTFWAAFSIENPETVLGANLAGAGAQGFNSSSNATSPNSLFTLNNTPNANGVSTDLAPDVVAKMVFEPGWGHYEVKGLARFFRDRFNQSNNTTVGGGVGAAAILPLHDTLSLIAEGLVGKGIGRYASGVGPDVMVNKDGTLQAISAAQFMGGLEYHPTSAWDIYAYYGFERYEQTLDGANGGYGDPNANLSGCNSDPPGGTCSAYNKMLTQFQPGFWYRFFKGKEGTTAVGVSYSYTNRQLWEGAGGLQPSGYENIVMTSVRYYLP
ncbi:MAG: hypothetical protein ACYDBV_11655 [Nitrospiria bacterium]